MKIITVSEIGYHKPSNANWSWRVYKIDFIDTDREYCHSQTTKACFVDISQIITHLTKTFNTQVIHTGDLNPCQKIIGINNIINFKDIKNDK